MIKDYFLYPHVGRMDDIWASYYVQAKGYRVVYAKASVYQDRNIHDPILDMRQEYIGYENNLAIVKELQGNVSALLAFLPPRAVSAFEIYKRHFADAAGGFVEPNFDREPAKVRRVPRGVLK